MNLFEYWLTAPAKPWEFWKGQSGAVGGYMAGAVITSLIFLIAWLVI